MLVITRATARERARFGLRRDAPVFPGERGRVTRLNGEGPGRLRRMAASICPQRPGLIPVRRIASLT
jgi:hypothetical protein